MGNRNDFDSGLRILSDLSFMNKPFCEDFIVRRYHFYLDSLYSRSIDKGVESELEFFHLYGNLLAEQEFDSICLTHITKRVLFVANQNILNEENKQDYIDKYFWIISLSSNITHIVIISRQPVSFRTSVYSKSDK